MRTAWSSGAEEGLISSRTTPYFLCGHRCTSVLPPTASITNTLPTPAVSHRAPLLWLSTPCQQCGTGGRPASPLTPMATAGATLSLAVVFLTLSPTHVLEMCHHICWRVTRSFSLTHIEECGTGWAWQHRPCAEARGFEVPLLNTYTLSWARVKKSFSQRS